MRRPTPDETYRREIAREWLGAQPGLDPRDDPPPEAVVRECQPAQETEQ